MKGESRSNDKEWDKGVKVRILCLFWHEKRGISEGRE